MSRKATAGKSSVSHALIWYWLHSWIWHYICTQFELMEVTMSFSVCVTWLCWFTVAFYIPKNKWSVI